MNSLPHWSLIGWNRSREAVNSSYTSRFVIIRVVKVKMSGPYKSYSTNMAQPTFYPNKTHSYTQQYIPQLSPSFERQVSFTGNYFPFLDISTRRSAHQNFSATQTSRQTSCIEDTRPSASHQTTQIPEYLLQPIYPWMKSKKGGKAAFGFGMLTPLITFFFWCERLSANV